MRGDDNDEYIFFSLQYPVFSVSFSDEYVCVTQG